MKNLFLALALLIMGAVCSEAAAKTTSESNFSNQVLNFLKQEGYMPSIDSDGDVKFKSEGDTYFVIAHDYNDGWYVKIMGLMGAEGVNTRAVLEACNATVAEYKFVRCYYRAQNSDIVYECAGYFTGIEQFKALFEDFMSILKNADSMLLEKYSEFS
ncbi:MAG: YbjN domain-containing protein [Muribaculaceae bacterium]|nr:YbjN domain-containing protein [Muribaculaceae bacterium]